MKLGAFLRDRREQITRNTEVAYENYDPTYGLELKSKTIEVIDFEELCNAIDEFSKQFGGN